MLIDDLQLVLKVAEFKSIKLAADSLNIRVATASAAIKRVEKAYGIPLFVRSTRNLRLSSSGEKYIPKIEEALLILNQIGQSASDDLNIVEGELRLAVPSDLGRNIVLPWLDEFVNAHPNLSVKLYVSDSNVDFFRDPVDLALRYGAPKDSSMYGFQLAQVPRVLCAAPSYLKDKKQPAHPNDLEAHQGLLYQLHDRVHDMWEFSRDENLFKVRMQSSRITNDAEIVRRWCVSGHGVAVKSALDMSNDLLSGKLVCLMPHYIPKPTELWLICPSRQLITPAVRLLREFVSEKCRHVFAQLKQAGVNLE